MRGRCWTDDGEKEREREKAWIRGPWSRASASTGLTGKRCYPALEAQGVPQGHESGSFCRRLFYRSGLAHELKASFEFSRGPELARFRICIYYCIDKRAHVFVSSARDHERSRRFAAIVVVRSKLRWKRRKEGRLSFLRRSTNDVVEWVSVEGCFFLDRRFFFFFFNKKLPRRPWSHRNPAARLHFRESLSFARKKIRLKKITRLF